MSDCPVARVTIRRTDGSHSEVRCTTWLHFCAALKSLLWEIEYNQGGDLLISTPAGGDLWLPLMKYRYSAGKIVATRM